MGENVSPREHNADLHNLIKREDSIGSENSVSHGNYSAENPAQSNNSFNSRIMGSGNIF